MLYFIKIKDGMLAHHRAISFIGIVACEALLHLSRQPSLREEGNVCSGVSASEETVSRFVSDRCVNEQ